MQNRHTLLGQMLQMFPRYEFQKAVSETMSPNGAWHLFTNKCRKLLEMRHSWHNAHFSGGIFRRISIKEAATGEAKETTR